MNEHLEAGEQCFRIIDEFEDAPKEYPDGRPFPRTASGSALEAYLCPSGQWTIGDGCCFWEDETPVRQGDTIPDGPDAEYRIRRLLEANVRGAEAYIRRHVTIQLNQYQFDALVSFRFNTRETTLKNSTRLLPAINRGDWEKAAVAFTEFVYGGSTYNGKPYQDAHRGLLRRRLCEGLVFLGLDWEQAVKDTDVALPCDRILLASGIYRDKIRDEGVTTLKQVREVAKFHPLPTPQTLQKAPSSLSNAVGASDELVLRDGINLPTEVRAAQEASPVAGAGSSGATQPFGGPAAPKAPPPSIPAATNSAVLGRAAGEKEAPQVMVPAAPSTPVGTKPIDPDSKPLDQIPYKVDPTKGAKPMEKTERFIGSALILMATVLRSIMGKVRWASGAAVAPLTGFLALFDNPETRAILIGFLLWLVGVIVVATLGVWAAAGLNKKGMKVKKRGEETSVQLMY